MAPVSRQAGDVPPGLVAPKRAILPSRRILVLAALLTVAGAGGVIAWMVSRQFTTPKSGELRITPLTTYAGSQLRPSFSSDGTSIAFDWDGPDGTNVDIYVNQIGQSNSVRLTTDPARDFSPAWSPDGRSIAALRDTGTEIGVLLIPAAGGPPREVSRITSPGARRKTSSGPDHGATLAWSPEGRYLFTSSSTGDDRWAIVRIDIETGEQLPVTTPPPGASDLDLRFPGTGKS